jgi:prepilin-type N-terminal cleavage/methylation domain-containing protein
MSRRALPDSGFTLLEMMVVVAILGVITAQLFSVFANQKRVFTSNERALDVQESARLTLDIISFDARMAGFMVPPWAAVASIDGGKKDADRLCLSSNGFAPPMNGAVTELDSQIRGYTGLAVTKISGNTITVPWIDVNNDGTPDLVNNQGVIVATTTTSYCARVQTITEVIKATTGIQTPIPGQYTLDFDPLPNGKTAEDYLGTTLDTMVVVPANIYELTGVNLTRNTLQLASGIEDFEVEYWLDNPGVSDITQRNITPGVGIEEGGDEFPVNDLNNPDPPSGATVANNEAIRRVRISLTARTEREEQADAASGHLLGSRPALANRDADPTPDSYRRRSFSASILPRNMTVALTGGM